MKEKYKKFKRSFKSILLFFAFLISILILLSVDESKDIKKSNTASSENSISSSVAGLDITTFDFVKNEIKAMEENKIAELKANDFNDKVQRTENIFARYGGYMSGYGELIVKAAQDCGGDYRYIVAIAGNESGFGRINYKLYNPFGYLDGVQYSGYEEALPYLTCRISQRFLVPCNHDLVCIVNKYGGSDTDKDKWVRNIQSFINQI